jgi:phosphoribosylformylglycinamidine synthase
MDWIREFVEKGGLVIGICNGFQVLLESGLLEGAMLRNRSTKFICKDVYLRCESSKTPFTSEIPEGAVLRMPIAHAEGNYYAASEVIETLEEEDRVIFRYADEKGYVQPDCNPNGSINNIAGICNSSRTVVGMMPHPERASEAILGGTDGLKLFTSVLRGM